ncbi:hypothetical protein [Chitinophaga barathri]|uniref:VCBS repeat-containing protein n=1 Tax=Chitinophaga barathri TaxID=1647451 RepID=A0A3N4M754_9BACT|nr:hypothetical protein [Chitinophaga barathri]RPD39161.1 hypothetical protein EG028_21355 [Chitinophaga barathri]
MKHLLIPVLMCFVACQLQPRPNQAVVEAMIRSMDSTEKHNKKLPPNGIWKKDTLYVTGDFNGDRRKDTAYSFMSDSVNTFYDLCYVRFTSGSLPDLEPTQGRKRLVNEGDLDYDGVDELSAFGEVSPDCSVSHITFSFKKGKWEVFTGPHYLTTSCAPMTDKDLQKCMVLENDTLFLWIGMRTNNKFSPHKMTLRTAEYYTME